MKSNSKLSEILIEHLLGSIIRNSLGKESYNNRNSTLLFTVAWIAVVVIVVLSLKKITANHAVVMKILHNMNHIKCIFSHNKSHYHVLCCIISFFESAIYDNRVVLLSSVMLLYAPNLQRLVGRPLLPFDYLHYLLWKLVTFLQ